jgi:hypothetical protein
MKETHTLEERIAALVPKLHPIQNHILHTRDDHVKNIYLVLLTSIAREDNVIGSKEQIYLNALCNGITGIELDKIITQLDALDDVKLADTLKTLHQNQLVVWFFIDAIILCRIDSPLDERKATLLGNLADALKISRDTAELCLKFAVIVLSQDRQLLLDLVPKFKELLPFEQLYEAYLSPWLDLKFSFEEEIHRGGELSGKYLIYYPVTLTGEPELHHVELIFSDQGMIRIGSNAKVNFNNLSIQNGHFECDPTSEVTFSKFGIKEGKGIICNAASLIDVNNGLLENAPLICEKVESIKIAEMRLESYQDQRAMMFTNCKQVIISSSKFENCGYDLNLSEKQDGGAIKASGSNLSIRRCSFEKCTSSSDGGALSFWNCVHSITDSKFIECQSAVNGGGMAIQGEEYADEDLLNDELFWHVDENDNGFDASITEDSQFIRCSAADSGGGFFDYHRTIRFWGCLFEKCTAKNTGGGGTYKSKDDLEYHYYGSEGYHRIKKCRFVENTAKEGDGLWSAFFNCIDHCNEHPTAANNDIVDSIFHRCSTNHDHESNSPDKLKTCHLQKKNKFTQ